MPEDVNGTGGGMQTGVSGPFGGQGGVVGGVNPNTNTNPFNNINPGTGSAPITGFGSGSGDIILDNSGRKRNKRVWLIVIIVVVALVLVGVGIILWKNGIFGSGSGHAAEVAANKYASFLLYGDTSRDIKSDEFELFSNYAIDEAIKTNDEGYFEELVGYWDDYVDLVNKDESLSENSLLMGYVEDQVEFMDFVMKYARIQPLSEEDIISLYKKNGKDNAYTIISSRYEAFLGNDYEREASYANAKIALEKLMLDIFVYYDEFGCIDGVLLNEDCAEEHVLTEDLWERYTDVTDNIDLEIADAAVVMLKKNSYEVVERTEEAINER